MAAEKFRLIDEPTEAADGAKEIKMLKATLWQMMFNFPTKRARKYSTASA